MKQLIFILSVFFIFGFTNPEAYEYSKIYNQDLLIAEGWKNSQGKKEAYWKFYYPNGKIKSEGHYNNDIAEKYWKFYYPNGTISKEGHVIDNKESDWWVFYDLKANKIEECEFLSGKRHGYRLFYKNNTELYKAKKYDNGILKGEWTDYPSFVKDNS